jgi:hypothetical protein
MEDLLIAEVLTLPNVEGKLSFDRFDGDGGRQAVFECTETTESEIGDRNAVDAIFAAFGWIIYSSPVRLSSVLCTQLRGGLRDNEVPEFAYDRRRKEVSCDWKLLLSRYFAEKKLAKKALESKVCRLASSGAVLLGKRADHSQVPEAELLVLDDKAKEGRASSDWRESQIHVFSAARLPPIFALSLEERQEDYVQRQVRAWQAAVCNGKGEGRLSVPQLLAKRAADSKLNLNDDGWTNHYRHGFF